MNSGKIIVPKGMLKAAGAASGGVDPHGYYLVGPLEAALRWLSENPIVPTLDQIESMRRLSSYTDKPLCTYQDVAVEWQRRMFLAPQSPDPRQGKIERVIKEHLSCDSKAITGAIIAALDAKE